MTIRVDLVPKPPYTHPVLLVDVFYGSAVGMLLAAGATQVWIAKSVRAALILAEGGGLLLGEEEGLPPEGFHNGLSLQALQKQRFEGQRCVLLAKSLAESLEQLPPQSLLACFRNARQAVQYAVDQQIHTVVAATQSKLEPSLANTVVAGFLAKRLHQALGQWSSLQEGARLATALLKSFPDPQESLVQSDFGKQLYRTGRSEDLALASLVSVEDILPRLTQVRTLEAQKYGLTKDRYGFCFEAR
ncbi:MAG: 2-phosphosulfolactate phosphatase [Meiothermus sp.]|uniref:2-phosphosulfolactate phosphatase n=1 Tax=Meiothermus sp. TaxID=1955249 RepID=UPI0025FDCCD9|nr:2-phosphosulfolactate phosphatase [Meiothermus sp.]MCS7068780.1 2-phosphosulfolactate phosphatase [Meiothermus sp.]MDW8425072.1 2-phosphosulfolactate phosphatase [Meiothermus sp.]